MTTSNSLVPCPRCGGPKLARAKVCSNCYAAQSFDTSFGHRRVPCPKCGHPKDYRAVTCRRCYGLRATKHPLPRHRQPGPDLKTITPEWAAMFRGFFLGEGTVSLRHANGGRGKPTTGVVLSVPQRADNLEFMQDIRRRLGGNLVLCDYPSDRNPMCRWSISGLENCLVVLSLLKDPDCKHSKMREIYLAIEFIEWRLSRPHKLSEGDRAIAGKFSERIRDMRVFKVLVDSQVISA